LVFYKDNRRGDLNWFSHLGGDQVGAYFGYRECCTIEDDRAIACRVLDVLGVSIAERLLRKDTISTFDPSVMRLSAPGKQIVVPRNTPYRGLARDETHRRGKGKQKTAVVFGICRGYIVDASESTWT
jgi:hypothetical protein